MKKNITIALLALISCASILYGYFENRKVTRLENEIIEEKGKIVRFEYIQRKNAELAKKMLDIAIKEAYVAMKNSKGLKLKDPLTRNSNK